MDFKLLSLSIFFICTAFIIWYPARWFNRSEVEDTEFSFVSGVCIGLSIACIFLQFA